MAKPNLTRAERIRRLIADINARIVNLRFAESLAYAGAYMAIERGGSSHPSHLLAVCAIRAAEILQARARRLARADIAAQAVAG